MFRKRLKYAQRYNEIIRAFLRNGFGYIMDDIGLTEALSISVKKDRSPDDMMQKTIGERIRNLLEELGTTFIKLGQIASTRRDLLPDHVITELEKLQNDVPPFSYEEAARTIEKELGSPVDQIFKSFEETPFATGSIGQVHQASLHSGEVVAVKIQRPNIRAQVETDLEILYDIAKLMDSQFEWAKKYNLLDIVDEISHSFLNELDFSIEGRNCEKIGNIFADDEKIRIPKIYRDYSTKKILTMEYISGIKINDQKGIDEKEYNRETIAETFANCMFRQIILEGFFHGDPHPGNVVIMEGEKIGLLDFGMVGHLNADMRRNIVSLLRALKTGDDEKIIHTLFKMGLVPTDIHMNRFQYDIERIRDTYYDLPVNQIRLGDCLNDLFSVALKHQVQIPAEYTILGKALVTMEGIIGYLHPNCNLFEIVEPYVQQFLFDYFHPKKWTKTTVRQITELGELLTTLPKNLKELMTAIEKGRLHFEVSTPEIRELMRKIDSVSNRLAFSIVLLSFSIVMVGLIIGAAIGGENTILWNFPIIEIGGVVASLMFLFLLYSIFKSGKF